MNKTVTIILSAGIFGVVGGFVGYAIGRKKYLALADKEIESIRSHQKEHDKYLLRLYGIEIEEVEKSVDVVPEPPKKSINQDKTNTKKNLVDYAQIYAPENDNSALLKSGIYLISDSDFDESENSYQSLQFYNRDGVVADMDDNCVRNYQELIGPTEVWLSALIADGASVYIRNENSEMDYEILYKDGKWTEVASPSQKAAALIELDSDMNGNSD